MENNPKKVIVHCLATPDTIERKFTVADVRRWHLERGFHDVGYHFVIQGDGTIEEGRNLRVMGAHAKGHNQDSVGIAYDGSFLPTIEQIYSFVVLYRKLNVEFGITLDNWFPHKDFANKECPGFDWESFKKLLSSVAI
jgi:N-acetylmuramoyl-L-alanine amidase